MYGKDRGEKKRIKESLKKNATGRCGFGSSGSGCGVGTSAISTTHVNLESEFTSRRRR
jgi:hypothetical protein